MPGRVLVDNRRTRATRAPVVELRAVAAPRAASSSAGYTDVSFDEEISGAQVGLSDMPDVCGRPASRGSTSARTLTTRLRGAQYDIEYAGRHQRLRRRAAVGHAHRRRDTRASCALGAQNVELRDGDSRDRLARRRRRERAAGAQRAVRGPVAQRRAVVGRRGGGARPAAPALDPRDDAAAQPSWPACAARTTMTCDTDRTFTPRSYATGDVGPAVALAGGILAALRLRLHLAGIRRRATTDAASSGAMVSFIYQPLQRRRVRND